MQQLKITNSITKRDSLAIEKYLTEISKIPRITPEEEVELAVRIRGGDQEALNKLTSGNLRFVVSVAKQYQNNGLSLPDLINEGNLGLIKAARRFDESKGFKFISYAVWWIRQAILQAIIEYSKIVRVPHNKLTSFNKLNEAYTALVQTLEREPSDQEIAEKLNISVNDVEKVLKSTIRHVSFDAPIGDDDDSYSLLDVMMSEDDYLPDKKMMEESISEDIQNGLSILAPREYEIIALFFGLDGKPIHTVDEIAYKFGITKERVRQVKERSIRRLKRGYVNSIMRKNKNSKK